MRVTILRMHVLAEVRTRGVTSMNGSGTGSIASSTISTNMKVSIRVLDAVDAIVDVLAR